MENKLNFLFLICFALIGSAGIVLWSAFFSRKGKGRDLLGRLGGRKLIGSPLGFIDVLLVFFTWLGGQAIAVGVAMLLMGISQEELPTLGGDEEAKLVGIVGLAQLVGILLALVVLYVRYGRGGRAQAIGIQPKNVVKDVGLGFAAFAMVIPIVLLVQWLLTFLFEYEHASLNMLSKDAAPMTFVFVWFVAGFVAPVCEEVFFRGTLQAWLQRLGADRMKSDRILVGGWDFDNSPGGVSNEVTEESELVSKEEIQHDPQADPHTDLNPYASPREYGALAPFDSAAGSDGSKSGPCSWVTSAHWPIYVTSAIFAGLHIGQGAAPIPLFLLAVVLGYLYRKTESILPCIILHMLLNTFSLFWFTLNVFFGGEPGL